MKKKKRYIISHVRCQLSRNGLPIWHKSRNLASECKELFTDDKNGIEELRRKMIEKFLKDLPSELDDVKLNIFFTYNEIDLI